MNSQSESSFRWCHELARNSGSNFYRSFGLLRRERAQGMEALYAFSRLTDDIGDGDSPLIDKQARLVAWTQLVAERFPQGSPVSRGKPESKQISIDRSLLDEFERLPIWPALESTVRRFAIPHRLLHELIRGVSRDLQTEDFATWEELHDYCYCVASTVGIACLHIWEGPFERLQQAAIDCGIAFQLTNILRDVREDANRGRIYLPLSDLERHGCSTDLWRQGNPDGDWLAVMKQYSARAKELYCSSWQIHDALDPESQRMFSLMWRTYYALLQQIDVAPDEVWHRRVSVSKIRKIGLAIQHFLPGLYRFQSSPLGRIESK